MNRFMPQERLVRLIRSYGLVAQEHRQVYRRLEQILPDRISMLIRTMMGRHNKVAHSTRAAYVSEEYVGYVEELLAMKFKSIEAKIQYETHMMLFEARQSLRKHR